MVKTEFCSFPRGTDLQKLATAKRTNGFLADNQIWEAQGPWFSEIYVCKSPQGGGGGVHGARGLSCFDVAQSEIIVLDITQHVQQLNGALFPCSHYTSCSECMVSDFLFLRMVIFQVFRCCKIIQNSSHIVRF